MLNLEKSFIYFSGLSAFTTYSAILGVLFICGLGVPIPEDITLITAGVLSSIGQISFIGANVAGFFGVLIGDVLLFSVGKKFGDSIFQKPFIKRLFSQNRLEKAQKKVLSNSKMICFTARFLPGLRAPIYLTSGAMGVSFITFLALDGLAALLSVPIWVSLGFYIGENLDEAKQLVQQTHIYLFLTLALILTAYIIVKRYQKKKKS